MMKKPLLFMLLTMFSSVSAWAEKPVQPVDGTSVYTLKAGSLLMTVDAGMGGRILSFKSNGREVISQSKWPESFGSTFWTSPQKAWNWPPVPEYDKHPYQVEQDGEKLILTSEVNDRLHFRIRKEFVPDAASESVMVTYSIINEGPEAQQVAPWEITRVPNSGWIFFDAPADSITPAGLMAFRSAHGVSWYEADVTNENRKINADGKGWLAYCNDGFLLLKTFQDLQPSEPAPGEAEIQVYVNRGKTYIELESQGAYTLLQPGESLRWAVRWYLRPCPSVPVPSSEILSSIADFIR